MRIWNLKCCHQLPLFQRKILVDVVVLQNVFKQSLPLDTTHNKVYLSHLLQPWGGLKSSSKFRHRFKLNVGLLRWILLLRRARRHTSTHPWILRISDLAFKILPVWYFLP